MYLPMSCPLTGNIAPGVEIMQTLIKSTFKTIESGRHNSMLWELIALLYSSIVDVISTDIQSIPFLVDFESVASCSGIL